MSHATLIRFWVAAAMLGALLVSRHTGAQPKDHRNGATNHTTFFRL
jgi:hypothetical protein